MNLVAYVVSQVKYDTVLEGAVGFFCGAVSQYAEFKSFFELPVWLLFSPSGILVVSTSLAARKGYRLNR